MRVEKCCHRKIVIGVLLFLLISACGKNPKDFTITEQNKDNFLEQIKDMKGLTVEEAGLLHDYVLRLKMSEAFGQKATPIAGKTIGTLIAEQKDLETKAKKEKADQDRLAAEAKAKEEALAQELRKAITLTVFQKSFTPSDYRAERYNDYIEIKCAYQNTSGRDIRAFTGRIQFTDLFEKPIYESALTISDPIKSGEKATWTGQIRYNQFIAEQQRLRNTALEDMKVAWLPRQVLFADATKLGTDATGSP